MNQAITYPAPTTISFIVTNKCTAACPNCCFECNPRNDCWLSSEIIKRHIVSAVTQWPSIRLVIFTGGECFMNIPKMLELCDFAKQMHLAVRIVTNCFWATSLRQATLILKKFKEVGLDEINYSTGDEHLQYVPLKNIVTAIKTSLLFSIKTAINVETHPDAEFKISEIFENPEIARLIHNNPNFSIIQGVWMPFTEEGISCIPPLPSRFPINLFDRCTNLFAGPVVSPENNLMSCCGLPVKYIPQMNLGNLSNCEITTLYSKNLKNFLRIWLFVDGPYKILLFIQSKINKKIPELYLFSHNCFYCACIYTNPNYYSILESYYREVVASVLFRYNCLIETNKRMLL